MIANTKNSSLLKVFVLLALMAALCLQCTDKPTQSPPTSQPIDLSEAEKALIESDNEFGLRLFRHINTVQGDSNIFISPLSISMALGMTLNGADGTTREAMEQTLELSGLTSEEINESYRHLIDLLTFCKRITGALKFTGRDQRIFHHRFDDGCLSFRSLRHHSVNSTSPIQTTNQHCLRAKSRSAFAFPP